MSYTGKNPTFRAITCTGFADFATADASPKTEGRLVWVQDENLFYADDGTTLSGIGSGDILFGKSIQEPTRLDMKQDTLAALTTYALTATNGQLCFSTDTKKAYQVIDGLLVDIGGGAVQYWQRELPTDLTTDGIIASMGVAGLTIGETYEVTLNVRAVRKAVSQNEIQELVFSAQPTYGLFQIEFNGQTTWPLPYDVSAAEVLAAMEALSTINPGEVGVSGSTALQFTFTFGGALANTDVVEITVPSNSLVSSEAGGTNEVQQLLFSATPTSGTFTIAFSDPYWDVVHGGPQSTAAIAFNASTTDVKNALELLDGINGVTVATI